MTAVLESSAVEPGVWPETPPGAVVEAGAAVVEAGAAVVAGGAGAAVEAGALALAPVGGTVPAGIADEPPGAVVDAREVSLAPDLTRFWPGADDDAS
jgi:hypothetical protein